MDFGAGEPGAKAAERQLAAPSNATPEGIAALNPKS